MRLKEYIDIIIIYYNYWKLEIKRSLYYIYIYTFRKTNQTGLIIGITEKERLTKIEMEQNEMKETVAKIKFIVEENKNF